VTLADDTNKHPPDQSNPNRIATIMHQLEVMRGNKRAVCFCARFSRVLGVASCGVAIDVMRMCVSLTSLMSSGSTENTLDGHGRRISMSLCQDDISVRQYEAEPLTSSPSRGNRARLCSHH
jgi:hypothetical protein